MIFEKEELRDRLSARFCESCNECNINTRVKLRNKAKRRRESNVMRSIFQKTSTFNLIYFGKLSHNIGFSSPFCFVS